MPQFPHLRITRLPATEPYTYARIVRGGAPFIRPPREPTAHAASLKRQLSQIQSEARAERPALDEVPGIVLEFQGEPKFQLWLDSLENQRMGIELLNARTDDAVPFATVFVPQGKIKHFLKLVSEYETKFTARGRKCEKVIESISEIRRATIRSFWTDLPHLFPHDDQPMWWEIWLRASRNTDGDLLVQQFRTLAAESGLRLQEIDAIRFAERAVVLAWGSASAWTRQPDLLDMVAELRKAKELPAGYTTLPPRCQREFVNELLRRTTPPSPTAPAVCILDTGVQQGHPLLSLALKASETLTVKHSWGTSDHHGHGTEMAGLALYGCLTQVLMSNEPLVLGHRLESVKVLPPNGANDPQSYGWLIQQAASRAEIQSPKRGRTFCLAITADGRDEGLPTSWSSALDQLASGDLDNVQRLIVASAGNCRTLRENDYEYPITNYKSAGVQDPSQSWNALTVGAVTDRVVIESQEWQGWQPIADAPGALSPASTTSLAWQDKAWPLKPEVVFEGGNWVRNAQGVVDCCDDVSLLTTMKSDSGRLFATTGDTSAAAAQVARMAAVISARYPTLWPETIRGLIVHSARWTPAMLGEFPRERRAERLRCYGYGVPDISLALHSAENATTLLFEGSLQPFGRGEDGRIVTKDMHLHSLPWPVEVLQGLGASMVRMHLTLSYFIEPNPGRRGWRKKHRYQSHGLRFQVKRPTETEDAFRQRLSREAWDDYDSQPATQGEPQEWHLGRNLLTLGSIHSDWWEGTATDLAACGMVGVFPVTGWWRERKALDRWRRAARYSLLISIYTQAEGVDLYASISGLIGVQPLVEIPIDA
jgi:hypothetical protein